MGRMEPEMVITQSVLDRLLDDDPAAPADPAVTRAQSFRQLKTGLRRDLEWLLNTRQTPLPAPEAFRELSRSLYNYGLPDLSSMAVDSGGDRKRLLSLIELAVARYEPRLMKVQVALEQVATATRLLRFRIEALLRVDPAPEQVSFDTVLELTSGEYEVK